MTCGWLCATARHAHASPDAVCAQDGYTPLIRAAEYGRVDAICTLIELGADLEAKDIVRLAQCRLTCARCA